MVKELTQEEKHRVLVILSDLSVFTIEYLSENTHKKLGDLGMSSLDRLELLVDVEKAFSISLENYPFMHDSTIEDIFTSITLKL